MGEGKETVSTDHQDILRIKGTSILIHIVCSTQLKNLGGNKFLCQGCEPRQMFDRTEIFKKQAELQKQA